jgi:signal transduction histidine kinase
MGDARIAQLAGAIRAIADGGSVPALPEGDDEIGSLAAEVARLAGSVGERFEQLRLLVRITESINAGRTVAEVLDAIYDTFRPLVPYDRMGFSLIEEEGQVVRAHWARSDEQEIRLGAGYSAPLAGSLRQVMTSRQPRILNDLESYLCEHPDSEPTALIVAEGNRSSLTCPLIAMDEPIGFLFFSCGRPHVYQPHHVELMREIAGQVALIVEKTRLHEKLVALNAEKNALLGMAAHDLRSPLAVVQGFVELVQDGLAGPITARQREIFAVVRRACQTMVALIDSLLDVSAIEAGRLSLEPREVELAPLLREQAMLGGMLAERKGIQVEVELDPELDRAVLDPHRVGQILANLISNAVKYSHPGSRIILSGRRLKDEVEIAVRDQGQGIPADDLPQLFRSYGRGSVRPTSGEKSTGLGLAIVRRMVEAHGGTVGVESTVGEGTTFKVRLPRRLLAAPAQSGENDGGRTRPDLDRPAVRES